MKFMYSVYVYNIEVPDIFVGAFKTHAGAHRFAFHAFGKGIKRDCKYFIKKVPFSQKVLDNNF